MKESHAILFFFLYIWFMPVEGWTYLYSKVFSEHEAKEHTGKLHLLLKKEAIPYFNHMIFSWNAMRPKQGFFRFKVQVRDAQTQQWYSLHTMAEWGADVQRSFKEERDNETSYHHVRLELPQGKKASGVKLVVEAHDGANLAKVRGLFINVVDLSLFLSELEGKKRYEFPSVRINDIPQYSQMILKHEKKDVLCSPTSTSMLVSYLLKQHIDPVEFANHSYDGGLNAYGSWPFNIAHAFEHTKGRYFFCVRRLMSFEQLYSMLRKNIPVVVSVRGSLAGAPKEYNNGHLLIVTGWSKEKQHVVCHDPAFESNDKTLVTYDITTFLSAWERSRRLAYCAIDQSTFL